MRAATWTSPWPRIRCGGTFSELSPFELASFANDRPVIDSELLSKSRRDRLSMYREIWRPLGLGVLMIAVWRNRFGVFALILGRAGRGACFRRAEVETFARFLPQIRLSEALMSHRPFSVHGEEESSFDAWAQCAGLSRKEREVVALAARGLRNKEIAGVLGTSPFTVRNQLAAAFRKVDVTTRAELVSAMQWRVTGGLDAGRARIAEGPEGPWMSFVRTRGNER